jgi:UDP-N-acetylmuramyl pentapeptide synthase
MDNVKNKIIIVADESKFLEIKKNLNLLVPTVEVLDYKENLKDFQIVLAKENQTEKIAKKSYENTFLVFNYDNESLREVFKNSNLEKINFGFSANADFFVSDKILTNEGINFKVNNKGSAIPIWLNKVSSDDDIYNALFAICVGVIFGLNIVEISEIFKKA